MKLIYRQHTVRRMFERSISTADVGATLASGRVIEDYPTDTPYPSYIAPEFLLQLMQAQRGGRAT